MVWINFLLYNEDFVCLYVKIIFLSIGNVMGNWEFVEGWSLL